MMLSSQRLGSRKKDPSTSTSKLIQLVATQASLLIIRYSYTSASHYFKYLLIPLTIVDWDARCDVSRVRTKPFSGSICEPYIYLRHWYAVSHAPTLQTRGDPMYEYFQCLAEHANGLPEELRKLILRSLDSDTALRKLTEILAKDRVIRSLLGTTQAIDIISGGIKSNALPEQAHAIVNHRVAVSRLIVDWDRIQSHSYNLVVH